MAVKLHRCPAMFIKIQAHPCWRVQSALDAAGIEYEVVKEPLSRGKRNDLERLSGQRLYPVIEFEDGTVYREESKDMAAGIRAGRLLEGRGGGAAWAAAEAPAEEEPAPAAEEHSHEHGHEHSHEHGEEHEH